MGLLFNSWTIRHGWQDEELSDDRSDIGKGFRNEHRHNNLTFNVYYRYIKKIPAACDGTPRSKAS